MARTSHRINVIIVATTKETLQLAIEALAESAGAPRTPDPRSPATLKLVEVANKVA